MSQHGLDHLWRHALLQEPCGKGVARIVESDHRQASPFQGLAEIAIDLDREFIHSPLLAQRDVFSQECTVAQQNNEQEH